MLLVLRSIFGGAVGAAQQGFRGSPQGISRAGESGSRGNRGKAEKEPGYQTQNWRQDYRQRPVERMKGYQSAPNYQDGRQRPVERMKGYQPPGRAGIMVEPNMLERMKWAPVRSYAQENPPDWRPHGNVNVAAGLCSVNQPVSPVSDEHLMHVRPMINGPPFHFRCAERLGPIAWMSFFLMCSHPSKEFLRRGVGCFFSSSGATLSPRSSMLPVLRRFRGG